MPLTMGETIGGLAASSLHAECLDKVLLSVQCCADATSDCANARVVGLGLSGQQLRGSLPEAIGNLGALTSLKVMPPFSLLHLAKCALFCTLPAKTSWCLLQLHDNFLVRQWSNRPNFCT